MIEFKKETEIMDTRVQKTEDRRSIKLVQDIIEKFDVIE